MQTLFHSPMKSTGKCCQKRMLISKKARLKYELPQAYEYQQQEFIEQKSRKHQSDAIQPRRCTKRITAFLAANIFLFFGF